MCNQHTIYFKCGHKKRVRFSTCRQKVQHGKAYGAAECAACMGYSYMGRSMSSVCSKCYQPANNVKTDDANTSSGSEPEVKLSWGSNTTESTEWSSRKKSKRSKSLLSIEVKSHEVVGHESWENNIVADDMSTFAPVATDYGWGSSDDSSDSNSNTSDFDFDLMFDYEVAEVGAQVDWSDSSSDD